MMPEKSVNLACVGARGGMVEGGVKLSWLIVLSVFSPVAGEEQSQDYSAVM